MERWRISRFVETATGAFAVAIGAVFAVAVAVVLFVGLAVCLMWIAERVG
jgi:hypothetical protein